MVNAPVLNWRDQERGGYSAPLARGEASMTDTLFDERRLVSRVLRHWQEMALGRDLPSKDHIDPWLIGDDWSYCMLLSLLQRGKRAHVPYGRRQASSLR